MPLSDPARYRTEAPCLRTPARLGFQPPPRTPPQGSPPRKPRGSRAALRDLWPQGCHDLVRVAHKSVQRVNVWLDLLREEAGREVVGPAVCLLHLPAQLVAPGEVQTFVAQRSLPCRIQAHYATPAARGEEAAAKEEVLPRSRPMRSAASFAPMVTSGTPVPGRVLAPTKYTFGRVFEDRGGRK